MAWNNSIAHINTWLEHVQSHVRRQLMDEIVERPSDWHQGKSWCGKDDVSVGYAGKFGTDRTCLYVNLNHFILPNTVWLSLPAFTNKVAGSCHRPGVQIPGMVQELRAIYDTLKELRVVFSGSSVMRLKEENPDLVDVVKSYNLRGFSFREYLNLMAGTSLTSYTLHELLDNHEQIAADILGKIDPSAYFKDYLHHGFYPFFLEKRNFSENLLKTMNMMIEVDILLIKQIDLKYLPKIRALLYLIGLDAPCAANVSRLSQDIDISRATVMNYLKYLKDARLIDALYPVGEDFPKKPSRIYLHNTNLMHVLQEKLKVDKQGICETFFHNSVHKDNKVNMGPKRKQFLLNETTLFQISCGKVGNKLNPDQWYVVDMPRAGQGNVIPLWLFGFLY